MLDNNTVVIVFGEKPKDDKPKSNDIWIFPILAFIIVALAKYNEISLQDVITVWNTLRN
jgi:hypothetical protein